MKTNFPLLRVVAATGCTDEAARAYLVAEEGDVTDAIISILGDAGVAPAEARARAEQEHRDRVAAGSVGEVRRADGRLVRVFIPAK
jgi:N-acetylmuramic acid 6-phosphate (MurNAc-6-P) etherase